jgi:hypothetical protein
MRFERALQYHPLADLATRNLSKKASLFLNQEKEKAEESLLL